MTHTREETVQGKRYRYTVVFAPAEEGGYVVTVPALPGCVSQGESLEEARAMIQDAIEGYLEVLLEDGQEIPIEETGTFTETVDVKVPSSV